MTTSSITTIKTLFEKLLTNINSTEFEAYSEIIQKKILFNKNLENLNLKNSINSDVEEILTTILPLQIKYLSAYYNNINNIERICEIYKKRENKIKILNEKNKKYILILKKFKKIINPFFKESLIDILIKQKIYLSENNLKKYLQYNKKELKLTKSIFSEISKLKIENKLLISNKNLTSELCIIILFLITIYKYNIVYDNYNTISFETVSDMYNYKGDLSNKTISIKNKLYFKINNRYMTYKQVIEYYLNKDLSFLLSFEEDFEKLFNVNLLGVEHFHLKELKLLSNILIKYYDKNYLRDNNIDKVLFVTDNSHVILKSQIEKITTFKSNLILGSVYSKQNLLTLTMSKKEISSTIFHELAHIKHLKINKKSSDFDILFIKLGKVYCNPSKGMVGYGSSNKYENLATIVECIMEVHYNDNINDLNLILNKLIPVDGNKDDLYKKTKLLKEYNFFPDNLKFNN